jgi:hypothetical protein
MYLTITITKTTRIRNINSPNQTYDNAHQEAHEDAHDEVDLEQEDELHEFAVF